MEEKKLTYEQLEHFYHSTVGLWAIDRDPKSVDLDWIRWNSFQIDAMKGDKPSMKPFDLGKAKAGAQVCTRGGKPARIICFDRDDANRPLITLVKEEDGEYVMSHSLDGKRNPKGVSEEDLMMVPEKKEGWINIYRTKNVFELPCVSAVFETEEKAKAGSLGKYDRVATIKIEWEE